MLPRIITILAIKVTRAGGILYVVGGTARDLAQKITPKDFDLEIFGIERSQLEDLLQKFGTVKMVGKSFGIYKLRAGKIDLDVAMPRTEKKTGAGHRGFRITADSTLSLKLAASRRDFTINAIYYNPLTKKFHDPFHGRRDLSKKVLRVVSVDTFSEDPLRALRALQFIARFGLTIEPKSKKVIARMAPQLSELHRERLWQEWQKLLLAPDPSRGLGAGMTLGLYRTLHPELVALKSTPQPKKWHPEGSVWNHSLLAVTRATVIAKREKLSDDARILLLLAALCHDFGKPFVTTRHKGEIHAYGHATAGVAPTKQFLAAIGVPQKFITPTTRLVQYHMEPRFLYRKRDTLTKSAIPNFARRITPATIRQMCALCEADLFGRGKFPGNKVPHAAVPGWLYLQGQKNKILDTLPKPAIAGKDLIALGFRPSPLFAKIIAAATAAKEAHRYSRAKILAIIKSCRTPEAALQKLQQR